jgi:predicted O-linked N-acetylglucosamine transferase (SPINDLY family)
MAAMYYRLTDDWSDPPGTNDQFYTEELVRLPRSFFCYQPSDEAPPVTQLPASANGYVTFGSLNNFAKLTPQVMAVWARLVRSVPNSRIVILAGASQPLAERVRSIFATHDVAADRVTVADRRPRGDYLHLINTTDIALDPFPFNGHTTTCDALWQGVPVVALAGETYVQRFGSSAHQNLGLQELVARSPDDYIQRATRLAGDLPRLATLRAELRDRMQNSPLLDFVGFTRELERTYRQLWARWCERASAS